MIPVCAPILDDRDHSIALEAIKSGWIGGNGEYIGKFEAAWAKYCNRKHGIAVNNGTSALIAAVNAFKFPPDSEIIIPSFTIISCPLAAIYNQCKPVFVDVNPQTWTMDQYQIINSITDKTRAIMPVHMYGHPANMDHIISIANTFKLKIIEDAAQAHGATYNQLGIIRVAGEMGDVSCFSFYTNKLITTGEGGMILTNCDIIADRLRSYRNLCFGTGVNRFSHTGLGNNLRMTNIQAAIGLSQMEKLAWQIKRKNELKAKYSHELKNYPIKFQGERNGYKSVNWMIGITIEDAAADLITHLSTYDIEARPFFSDLNAYFYGKRLYESDRLSYHGLYLPSSSNLSDSDFYKVINAIKNYFD